MSHERNTPSRQHALRAFRHGDYRLLWASQLLTSLGEHMYLVAVGWHVYVLTDSPLQVGLLGLARALPTIVLSLAGGAAADLVNRRLLLTLSQASTAALAGLLALSTATGSVSAWLIVVVWFLSGAAAAFESPARHALVPTVVPRDELAQALTLNTLARQVGTIVGPGIGGVLIGQLGMAETYAVTAAMSLATVAAVLLMRIAPVERASRPGGWDAVLGGLRYARAEPIVLWALVLDFLVSALGNVRALLPVFARDVLLVGPEGLGLLAAAPAAGGVIGGLALAAVGSPRRTVSVALAAAAARGLFVLAFGLSPFFGLSLALLFAAGVAELVMDVLILTIVQVKTPDQLQGRVMALNMVFVKGGPQLGQLQSGAVASVLGPVAATALGGAAVALAVAAVARSSPMRRAMAEMRDVRHA